MLFGKKRKNVKWGTDNRIEHYLVISRSGFEKDIMDKDVTLIDLNTLERITKIRYQNLNEN